MSSDTSSTKVNCVSVKSHTSAPQSLLGDVSKSPVLTKRDKKPYEESLKSFSKDLPQSSSKGSSKAPSKCSSPSLHSSQRSNFNSTLSDLNTKSQKSDKSSGPMSPAVKRYVASSTPSNPQYALFPTTARTKVDYQTRMQAFLNDFDNIYEVPSEGQRKLRNVIFEMENGDFL